jgi:hypothetical protein
MQEVPILRSRKATQKCYDSEPGRRPGNRATWRRARSGRRTKVAISNGGATRRQVLPGPPIVVHARGDERGRRTQPRGDVEGVCHSHDFCDANMAIEEAWTSFGLDSVDGDNEFDCRLWALMGSRRPERSSGSMGPRSTTPDRRPQSFLEAEPLAELVDHGPNRNAFCDALRTIGNKGPRPADSRRIQRSRRRRVGGVRCFAEPELWNLGAVGRRRPASVDTKRPRTRCPRGIAPGPQRLASGMRSPRVPFPSGRDAPGGQRRGGCRDRFARCCAARSIDHMVFHPGATTAGPRPRTVRFNLVGSNRAIRQSSGEGETQRRSAFGVFSIPSEFSR